MVLEQVLQFRGHFGCKFAVRRGRTLVQKRALVIFFSSFIQGLQRHKNRILIEATYKHWIIKSNHHPLIFAQFAQVECYHIANLNVIIFRCPTREHDPPAISGREPTSCNDQWLREIATPWNALEFSTDAGIFNELTFNKYTR